MNIENNQELGFFLSRMLLNKKGINSEYRQRMLFDNFYKRKNDKKWILDRSNKKTSQNKVINHQELEQNFNKHIESNNNLSIQVEDYITTKSTNQIKYQDNSNKSPNIRRLYKKKTCIGDDFVIDDQQSIRFIENQENQTKTLEVTPNKNRAKFLLPSLKNNNLTNENYSPLLYSNSHFNSTPKKAFKDQTKRLISSSNGKVKDKFHNFVKSLTSVASTIENLKDASMNRLNSERSNTHYGDCLNEDEEDMKSKDTIGKMQNYFNRVGITPQKSCLKIKIKRDLSQFKDSECFEKKRCLTPISNQNRTHMLYMSDRALTERKKTINSTKYNESKKLNQINPTLKKIYSECDNLHENIINTERKFNKDGREFQKIFEKMDGNLEEVTNSNFPSRSLILI